ncbi:MAG: hypothetical protein L6R40_006965 [Gallowayella cf. fulva]|nr:MAG: hypothetical protein L6R40_006965 [Xanthomendoza cf. fulva]
MHPILPLLAYLLTAISATPFKGQGLNFDYIPFPGPIPFSNPGEWPKGTTSRSKGGLPTDTATFDTMATCLRDYGSNAFYDSWAGAVCGGMGWFKGTVNDKVNPYDCYQSCAPWLLYDGVRNGEAEYLCDYRNGFKGHCWMGYHRATAEEIAAQSNATEGIPAV